MTAPELVTDLTAAPSLLPDGPVRGLLPAAIPPLRAPIAAYLAYKSSRITAATKRSYTSKLRALERFYPALALEAFEPPAGTLLIEDFLTATWGHRAGKTYNHGLSCLRGFFDWQRKRGNLLRNPTEYIEEAREDAYQRTMFTDEECARILAANHGLREQIALRLLLFYGIRKGALINIRLGDFDEAHGELRIFTKGQRFQTIEVPAAEPFWSLLAALGEPDSHFLVPRQRHSRRRPPHRKELIAASWEVTDLERLVGEVDDPSCAVEIADALAALDQVRHSLVRAGDSARVQVKLYEDEQIGEHGMHRWWYRCLERAEVVEKGTTSGRRLHSARHTSAQRLLDHGGSVRDVQELLGHKNSAVTEVYIGPRGGHVRSAMAGVLGLDEDLHRQISSRAPERTPKRVP